MIKIEELKPRNHKKYGRGSITQKGNESYVVKKSNKYYCSCRTYEHAYYVREELNKCNWDKNELPRILEEYPFYYTDLMEFYRYVTINHTTQYKWCISIPSKKSDNGVTQQVRCTHIEDALWERDFLVEHNWDYELLVYSIDDTKNPYYDVELPPYPQRKIKNVSVRNNHKEELLFINLLLTLQPTITQKEICDLLRISDMTLRNWFNNYNTNWMDYRKMVFRGINPLDELKFNRRIYKPDLSLKKKKKKKKKKRS